MIEKTEAIALRIIPYSKTSQVVTWLTPASGKLVTLAKGALRPKSFFLGQYDLFYTCELLLYRRERNSVHILREASPLQTRNAFRDNWKAEMYASYICDLALRVSQENHGHPELYELIESSLDHLCGNTVKPQFVAWFELKLMNILGMAPQLTNCQSCRSRLPLEMSSRIEFSCSRGGIICPSCSRKHGSPGIHITPDVLAMLRRWQASDSAAVPCNTRITEKQMVALRRILATFLDYHLDFVPASRSIVMNITMDAAQGEAFQAPGKQKQHKNNRRE